MDNYLNNKYIVIDLINNISSKLCNITKNYKNKIMLMLLSISMIGASLLSVNNISGIISKKGINLKKIPYNSSIKDNTNISVYNIRSIDIINTKNNTNNKNNNINNKKYVCSKDYKKIKHLFNNDILNFLSNKYNIKKSDIIFYVNKSNNYLNNIIDDVWSDIISDKNDIYKYVKNNLLQAYGSDDNVKNVIKRIVMIENSGIKNTKRDIVEFLLQWGMSDNIYTFKSNTYSTKGAIGICQITKKAVDEVNNKFNFNNTFNQVAQNHKKSIQYAMMLQAIHYDVLRYDIDIKVSKRSNNHKVNKNKKNKSQDVKFVTTDSIFYKIFLNLPQKDLLYVNEYLLAVFYNKGPSVKKIINKKYKNTDIVKMSPKKAKALLLATLHKNIPEETNNYIEKFKKVSKLSNI